MRPLPVDTSFGSAPGLRRHAPRSDRTRTARGCSGRSAGRRRTTSTPRRCRRRTSAARARQNGSRAGREARDARRRAGFCSGAGIRSAGAAAQPSVMQASQPRCFMTGERVAPAPSIDRAGARRAASTIAAPTSASNMSHCASQTSPCEPRKAWPASDATSSVTHHFEQLPERREREHHAHAQKNEPLAALERASSAAALRAPETPERRRARGGPPGRSDCG